MINIHYTLDWTVILEKVYTLVRNCIQNRQAWMLSRPVVKDAHFLESAQLWKVGGFCGGRLLPQAVIAYWHWNLENDTTNHKIKLFPVWTRTFFYGIPFVWSCSLLISWTYFWDSFGPRMLLSNNQIFVIDDSFHCSIFTVMILTLMISWKYLHWTVYVGR